MRAGNLSLQVYLVYTHNLYLLASLVAHDRATEDTHKHTGKERKYTWTNTRDTKREYSTYSLDREVLTPSPCE